MDTTAKPDLKTTRDDVRIMTLQAHILEQQVRYPQASGTFSWILSALSISAKIIADKVRRARLENVLGSAGTENVQGEVQQKLDVIANEVLLGTLGGREGVAIVASEENEEPVILREDNQGIPRYCVLFDPLDGSSNLDVCGGVGTIFSILALDGKQPRAAQALLQPGRQGNRQSFPEGYRRYLDWAQSNGYSSRYSGAMVADVHRILLKGGVFLYPPTRKAPQGKLRLMYEANPMAMLIEQAGGKILAGREQPIMAIEPTAIHQRTPVILGAADQVDQVLAHL